MNGPAHVSKAPGKCRLVSVVLAVVIVAAVFTGLKMQTRAKTTGATKAGATGLALYKKGEFDKAIPRLKEAVKLDSANVAAERTLGQSYEAIGKLEEAVQAYEAALAAKADQPEVLYNLAIIHKSQGKLDKAVEELEKAVAFNKQYVGARLILADLYVQINDEAAAKKHYSAVLRLKPFGVDLDEVRQKLNAL